MSKKSSRDGLVIPVLVGAAAAAVSFLLFKDEVLKGKILNKSSKSIKMARYPKNRKKGRPSGTGAQTQRIKKLLSVISEKKKFTLHQIRYRFPSVTERTLRRDLDKLVRDGKVKKTGNTRATIYIRG